MPWVDRFATVQFSCRQIFLSESGYNSHVKPHLTDTPRRPIAPLVLLGLIVLAAALLRIYQSLDVLWIDELHTSWVVADGLRDVAPRARIGNQSPLYFYVVWFSTLIFGTNEIALRLPSLIAGIALVPLAFVAVRRWTDSTTAALLAAALVALERDFVFFSQETRPYAMVQLVALLQLMFFARLTTAGESLSKWWKLDRPRFGFVLSTVVLFYLHYTAALLVLGEWLGYLCLLAARPRETKYRPTSFSVDLILIAVCCLPATTHLLEIAARRGQWSSIAETWPSPRMVRTFVAYIAVPLFLATTVIVIRWLTGQRPRARAIQSRASWLVICWTTVAVGVAWLATLGNVAQLSMFRYVIGAAAGQMIVAGLCCAVIPPPGLRIAAAMFIALFAVAVNDMFYYAGTVLPQYRVDGRLMADRSENWKGAVDLINASSPPNQPVLLFPNLVEDGMLHGATDEWFVEYCTFPLRGLYLVDEQREVIPLPTGGPRRAADEQIDTVVNAGGAWLIVRGTRPLAVGIVREIVGQLPAGSNWRIAEQREFGYVHVVRLVVESSENAT